jgi:hypothetical protein
MGVHASSTIPRRRCRGGWEAAAALGAVALVIASRRVGRRSGVSTAELHATLPGDDLVPQPVWASTRATTISARPERVWPWIVQMGHPTQRAGWYTPHWLDRLQWGIRARSAERIRPEFQQVQVGDRIADSADGSVFFTVREIEPCETLVLHSRRHLLGPVRSVSFSWAFHLAPVGADETRLTIRARVWYEPRWTRFIIGPLIAVGDFVNASSMLRGIRRRAERTGQPRQTVPARQER